MKQVFATSVTERLGITHPIIQGGMMWVSQPPLVAAVSNAGGLGILTALTYREPDQVADAIAETRRLTDAPFGVNLTFLPTLIPVSYDKYIDVILQHGISIVETAGRNPQQYLPRLQQAGVTVIHKCTSIRHAKKAESIGCDMVSIDGFECAGHPGEEDVTSLILVPRAVDELKVPVIASGGFADGRGLVAALALGAGAINMGTRFVATAEAPVHDNVKQWLVRAKENETTLVMRSLRNTERVLNNSHAQNVLQLEAKGAGLAELAPLLSGSNGLRMITQGDTECGLMAAGQCVGLIHEVVPVARLIEGIIEQARGIVEARGGLVVED